MFRKFILLAIMLDLGNTGFSQISKSKWVTMCKKAKGERKNTCDILRSKFQVYPSVFSGNWARVYNKITDIEGLDLSHHRISDLSPLSALANLKWVSLRNNRISDLSPLKELINLERIYLDYNQVSDLSPLSELTNLSAIKIDNNRISNLSPLIPLINLQSIFLRYNQITDVSPLAGLSSIESVSLTGNQIQDFSPLDHLGSVDGRPNRCLKGYKLISRTPTDAEIDNDDIICPVCIDDFKDEDDISEIPECHHIFHKDCLRSWLDEQRNCPSCRICVSPIY